MKIEEAIFSGISLKGKILCNGHVTKRNLIILISLIIKCVLYGSYVTERKKEKYEGGFEALFIGAFLKGKILCDGRVTERKFFFLKY